MISRLFPLLAVFLVIATMATTTEAKILDAVLKLFDAPSQEYFRPQAQNVDKTVEFLAFGDAAMDYYTS